VESSKGTYESRILAVAIGIFGRPNKPKDYRLLPSLKERLLFDMTSYPIQNEDVLVVNGGDTADGLAFLVNHSNDCTVRANVSLVLALSQAAEVIDYSKSDRWSAQWFSISGVEERLVTTQRRISRGADFNCRHSGSGI
jgi:hypothetical protein